MNLPPATWDLLIGESSSTTRIFFETGGLQRTGWLDPWTQGRDVLILTDETVAGLYLEPFRETLGAERLLCHQVVPGERSKNMESFLVIIDRLLDSHFGRDMILIGLGGGVIGDLGGFVAATYQRGVDYLLCPTTLIAQLDACLGGKTGIDLPKGKNLIGAFHYPKAIGVDPSVLETLSCPEFRSGLAEAIKYGVGLDEALFNWIENHLDRLLSRDATTLDQLVRCCLALKSEIINLDPKETGSRRVLLNLGHTFGHAIEAATGYAVRHGEAVAVGLLLAAELSCRLNGLSRGTADRIQMVVKRCGFPVCLPPLETNQLLPFLFRDKKNQRGQLVLVLPQGLGQSSVVRDPPLHEIVRILDEWPRSPWPSD
jgi:3-dehydroquinate synthase